MKQYRAKGSIGLIVPPRCNETNLEEAYRLRPPGLTWCVASLGMSDFGGGNFDRALANMEEAARELAERQVSVIVPAGIPLQVHRGPHYYEELEEVIQAAVGPNIPIATDVRAVLMAIHAMGATRVSAVTPYQEVSLRGLVETLSAHDFDVVSANGEEVSLAQVISSFDFDSSYTKAMESYSEQPDTDLIYISCPQWPVLGNVERIEKETGKPVVTQLTAIMWWAVTTLGLRDRITGYGRILEDMPAPAHRATTHDSAASA